MKLRLWEVFSLGGTGKNKWKSYIYDEASSKVGTFGLITGLDFRFSRHPIHRVRD